METIGSLSLYYVLRTASCETWEVHSHGLIPNMDSKPINHYT